MSERIHGTKDIAIKKVHSFWSKRARVTDPLTSVLLGDEKGDKFNAQRNALEKAYVLSNVGKSRQIILDIGCGTGRWAKNLSGIALSYDGIDYTRDFIIQNKANAKYNQKFVCMSATELDRSKLKPAYSLIICTGVMMYINDKDLIKLLKSIADLATLNYCSIYLQESVSTSQNRLTLDDIQSDNLSSKYSAIYRTQVEYEKLFDKYLNDFYICSSRFLFSEKDEEPRYETNAKCWFLRRRTK